ncbi:MAG: hypothetical protein Q8M02_10340 [Candidatus Didemnitutus sp.]|nr:hypothetical protein [Candidatus Didemnitutus sp.]
MRCAFPRFRRAACVLIIVLGVLGVSTTALAFPPAPFFTLFGTVRDEQGQTLRVDGAVVVFYRNGVEVLRQTIVERVESDQNYQIRLRMDMQRAGTIRYSDIATASGTSFSLAVLIHNIPYYPIEMSVSRTVGSPGERVRLDLTLGIDSDGDGIPDAWEQSQLFAAGIMPGPNGWDLSQIDRNGDFDGDGVSNWAEYIAGTFATDPTDYLSLRIVEKSSAVVRLRFFSIFGKVYSLEASTDLQNWAPVSHYLRSPDPSEYSSSAGAPLAQPATQATATDFLDIFASTVEGSVTPFFYRLKVR